MLRIIQWATGSVGRHAVAAVHDHPDLELVGAIVYSDAKAGRDVGDGCGIGDVGLTATTDPDEIVALDADCVLYMPQGEMNPMGALDDICRLLMSGKNVVSTAVTGLIYPRSLGDRVVERGSLRRGADVVSRHQDSGVVQEGNGNPPMHWRYDCPHRAGRAAVESNLGGDHGSSGPSQRDEPRSQADPELGTEDELLGPALDDLPSAPLIGRTGRTGAESKGLEHATRESAQRRRRTGHEEPHPHFRR